MIRISILAAINMGLIAMGPTCLPLTSSTDNVPGGETTLGVSIQRPAESGQVPQGAEVTVEWSAVNTTGQAATARLYVESRTDLNMIVLLEGEPITGTRRLTSTWDTTDAPADSYRLIAEISTVARTESARLVGEITVNAPPKFEFVEPTGNSVLGEDAGLEITYSGFDPDGGGRVTIGLDPDEDHQNGDELFIEEESLPASETEQSFTWEGETTSGEAVDPGTYNLFAVVTDDFNPDFFVDAGVTITVQEPDPGSGTEPEVTLGIREPSEDTNFVQGSEALEIEFTVNEEEDVLIDLKIDTDDNHANGNEITILSQRLVEGGTESDTFSWDGTDSGGDPVPAGIYRLFIVANTGGAQPEIEEGEALIFRRETEGQPLIALLAPATIITVEIGQYVTIQWRDELPEEGEQEFLIRLTLDDDPRPNEGEPGSAEDMAELELVADLESEPDGDQYDRYFWQVPASLEPGTYYVFAYIGPSDQELSHISVSPGRLILDDPANP